MEIMDRVNPIGGSGEILPEEESRRASRLPLALAALPVTGALCAVAAGLFYASTTGDTSRLLSHLALTPFITVVYALVGERVASRHPRNPIGWIFLAVGLFYALAALAGVYQDYASAFSTTSPLPAGDLAAWLDLWLWIPAVYLSTIFVFLLFPDGRLLSPRWRIAFGSAALGMAASILAVALHPGPLEGWETGLNPYGLPAWSGALEALSAAGSALTLAGFLAGLASFILRFRNSQGAARAQLKWLAYALAFVVLGTLATLPLWAAGAENPLAAELAMAVFSLTVLGIAVAAAVAILRYHLYDIDLVINRTLVYGALTGGIVLVYVLVVGGLGSLFQARGSPLVALLATGVVAVLFQPSRDRLQRGVDRLFYGERDEPLVALSRLGSSLKRAITPELVLPTLVETIAQTLKLPYVAIRLRAGDEFILAAEAGQKPAPSNRAGSSSPFRLPLVFQGEAVGELVASPRAHAESFCAQDQRLLETIAHQAGPAVHTLQLTAELQHSREQLVKAREEERRRLRRDLHDGLGATLAALLLETGALRRAIRSDPARAEALVDEFRGDIRATIDDVRRLVYELRPPTLDQLGLIEAVRVQARQCSRSSGTGPGERGALQVRVEAPEEFPPLPAAVEVAAYRITQEALTNIVHHSQARRCLVRLDLGEALEVEVLDDGVGLRLPADRKGGVGLLSMRERAEELGGTLRIEPGPKGGTRVLASLPFSKEGEE
jgi:two-component system, NarL family, sensor kinase